MYIVLSTLHIATKWQSNDGSEEVPS